MGLVAATLVAAMVGAAEPAATDTAAEIEALKARVAALEAEAQARAAAPAAPSEPAAVGEPVVAFYGSLRFRGGYTESGGWEMNDKVSRVGLRARATLDAAGDYLAIARLELGVRVVSRTEVEIAGGDPGGAVGEEYDALTSRLGILGFETPYGVFTWGKQWSTYADVALTTDRFLAFGGEGVGVYPDDTDGGIAGSGRADRAFQYRVGFGAWSVGLQTQNRTSGTVNDQAFGDTVGGSLRWQRDKLTLGVARQQVNDGVATPIAGAPKSGDRAVVVGALYQDDGWLVAANYARTEQHEVDDLGRWFDGEGFELYAQVDADGRRWYGGVNYLEPEAAHPGSYRLLYGSGGVAWPRGKVRPYVELRLDAGRRSDGRPNGDDAVAFGIYFDF
jgi:predicted porin